MNIGTIIQWASNTIPSGWLLCDGSAVSRSTYSDLFSVIGTNFGVGDGSTTFNLPDLRGRNGIGLNSTDLDFDTLGKTGGSKTNTLSLENYAYKIYNTDSDYANNDIGGTWNPFETQTNLGIGSNYVTNKNTPVNNLQPYVVVNYIIKATTPDTIKISELNEITTLDSTDVLPIVDVSADETKKITASNLLNDTYSTNETITNKKWIDGKPIYRKVYTSTTNSANTTIETFANISNWNIITLNGWIYKTSTIQQPIGMYANNNNYSGAWVDENGLKLILPEAWVDVNCTYHVIVEYTKTTD